MWALPDSVFPAARARAVVPLRLQVQGPWWQLLVPSWQLFVQVQGPSWQLLVQVQGPWWQLLVPCLHCSSRMIEQARLFTPAR